VLYLVLMLWISWFYLYWSLFFTVSNNMENIYCEYKGKVFRFLNSSLQESLFPEFIIILIILFLDPKNINTLGWVTPENYTMSHNRLHIGKIDHLWSCNCCNSRGAHSSSYCFCQLNDSTFIESGLCSDINILSAMMQLLLSAAVSCTHCKHQTWGS